MPHEQFERVQSAITSKAVPNLPDLNALLATPLGSRMYLKEGQEALWNSYIQQIGVSIKGIMDHNFEAGEVEAFKNKMAKCVLELTQACMEVQPKAVVTCNILGFAVDKPVSNLSDYWKLPYYTARLHCGINSKRYTLAPHEILLLGEIGISVRMAIQIERNACPCEKCFQQVFDIRAKWREQRGTKPI